MSTRHCLVVGTHDGGQDIDLPPHQDLLPGGGHQNIQKEIEDNPLMFGKIVCKEKDSDVYLGDVISSQGLEHSVELTVQKRLGLIRGAMYETISPKILMS